MRKNKKITHHHKKSHKSHKLHRSQKRSFATSQLKAKLNVSQYHYPTRSKSVKSELERSDVIQGMALLLQDCIMRYELINRRRNRTCNFPGPRIFNSTEYSQIPEIDQIQEFIQTIFDKRRLHVESGIIALILLHRTGINIHSQNWMRLVLISLLLANKHCEDVYSVYNAKFVGIIPNLENLEINILELEFLKFLKYRLHIETETYEEYYAILQNFFPIEEEEDNSSNTEETDSIEEEEYRENNSTSSTDTIDQNPRNFRDFSRYDESIIEESADEYPSHSPSISERLDPDTNRKLSTGYDDFLKLTKSVASSENLWRDCHFAKESSLA